MLKEDNAEEKSNQRCTYNTMREDDEKLREKRRKIENEGSKNCV